MLLLSDPTVWASFATLTVMEIVLGIDNIVFISVIINRLPAERAELARKLGLAMALIFRILLLFVLTWIIGLKAELFTLFNHSYSWRDLILIVGGAFLIYKATSEIHMAVEGEAEGKMTPGMVSATFAAIVGQIAIVDMVFSIDSIVTAIGMAEHVQVMICAVIVAVGVMYFASGAISRFIRRHPTTKVLALAFLLLIGVSLVADGFGLHIPRGYIYAAMAFSVLVETLNIAAGSARKRNRKSNP